MTKFRPGRVPEATVIGIALLLAALFGGPVGLGAPGVGRRVHVVRHRARLGGDGLRLRRRRCCRSGCCSTPRDYLSAFMKIGTILVLGTAIIVLMPPLKMPAITQFVDGTGPVFAGKWFPFAFITIACGAVSGLPRARRQRHDAEDADAARPTRTLVGYGSMLTESFVGLMAMIAAATLDPGVYFAMNVGAGTLGATADSAATKIAEWGFMVTPQQLNALAAQMGEATLLSRTGGAPSLAVGMADILSSVFTGRRPRALVSLRHHVRGAVHPHDDRRRHPRRPLHAAGAARPRLGAAGAHVVVPEHPRLLGSRGRRAGATSSTRA